LIGGRADPDQPRRHGAISLEVGTWNLELCWLPVLSASSALSCSNPFAFLHIIRGVPELIYVPSRDPRSCQPAAKRRMIAMVVSKSIIRVNLFVGVVSRQAAQECAWFG
jgi:hypothetical protein